MSFSVSVPIAASFMLVQVRARVGGERRISPMAPPASVRAWLALSEIPFMSSSPSFCSVAVAVSRARLRLPLSFPTSNFSRLASVRSTDASSRPSWLGADGT